ncbi:MAG: hypothetical protein Fur0023_02420 [Bacteroidia bacterium]
MSTLAFTICFAVWMFNGVLVTFLVDNQIYKWTPVQIGWLMAIPPLTGSIFRLNAGIWTDKYGGKITISTLLFLCAIPMYLLSHANSFVEFALCGFGFGLAGNAFSMGIAYVSLWYPKNWQGRALGIFGVGNAGAAVTTMIAPSLLKQLTNNGANLEGWRNLPVIYAAALVVMGILFFLFTENKKSQKAEGKSFAELVKPLKEVRVWRFGLYYYLVFGCFVALSQWLVPYFLNLYNVSLVTAGIFASIFSIPAGVIRALGGWMSDKFGARSVMYWTLGSSVIFSLFLCIPKMEIDTPGKGIMAKKAGTVTFVSDTLIKVDDAEYKLVKKKEVDKSKSEGFSVFPSSTMWQEPVVKVGDVVKKKQLLVKGTTHISFQANMWIALVFIFIIGFWWGIGKAAVYKHIAEYYPNDVGAVGGMVGLLGGLGGFISPIIFGYLLDATGMWTSMWPFLFAIGLISLLWMHRVITKMRDEIAPETKQKIEKPFKN